MKKLSIQVNNFEKIIRDKYLYIDKTRHIYDLVTATSRYYFISRPRGFGKTILISSLQQLFLNNRILFKDLWIDSSDYNWLKHPIVLLTFSGIKINSVQVLTDHLSSILRQIAHDHSIDLTSAPTMGTKFKYLVQQLAKHRQVVILIDDYNAAISKNIQNTELANQIHDVLSNVFRVIKSLDKHLRFVFITGKTSLRKSSLLTSLNVINDITKKPIGAALLGYTDQEINTYIIPYLKQYNEVYDAPVSAQLKEMRQWCNIHRFSDTDIVVRNPCFITSYISLGHVPQP